MVWHTFCLCCGMNETNILDGRNKWPTRFRTMPRMPEPLATEAGLRDLRLRYNAAYSAYQNCVIALNEAAMSGQAAAPELLKQEAQALADMTEARGQLLAAMAAATRKSH
jgi:hypothetical protein